MAGEPKSLVRVEEARLPDAYEQSYMAGEGVVLYRDKRRAPWPLHALLGAAGLAVVAGSVASGQLLGLAIALPVLALIWVLFSVLRVTVSAGVVAVQYGLFGPEIPVAAIDLCEATTYDWKKFLGNTTYGTEAIRVEKSLRTGGTTLRNGSKGGYATLEFTGDGFSSWKSICYRR